MAEKIAEEPMGVKNFPKIMTDIKSQTQAAQRTPNRMKGKEWK